MWDTSFELFGDPTTSTKSFQKKAFYEENGEILQKEMVIDTEKLIEVMTCQYVFVEIY